MINSMVSIVMIPTKMLFDIMQIIIDVNANITFSIGAVLLSFEL